ncbi:uncharacterized protein LOC143452462 [Clavelina lepadiformis]|uniref:uncharacterized protein LOC143452462 n=1 Tax=Clavelina lepadiformis TaxID=159417 RepID=UPI00404202F6
MPLTENETIQLVTLLAKQENLQVNVGHPVSKGKIFRNITVLGGILVGPLGIIGVREAGLVIAAAVCEEAEALPTVINALPPSKQLELVNQMCNITSELHAKDAPSALALVNRNGSFKIKIIATLVEYFQNLKGMKLDMQDICEVRNIPLAVNDAILLIILLAEQERLQVTVRRSVSFKTGCVTVLGGALFGSLGMITAAGHKLLITAGSNEDIEPLPKIIRALPESNKLDLADHVRNILSQLDEKDALTVLALINRNGSLKMKLVELLLEFFKNHEGLEVNTQEC